MLGISGHAEQGRPQPCGVDVGRNGQYKIPLDSCLSFTTGRGELGRHNGAMKGTAVHGVLQTVFCVKAAVTGTSSFFEDPGSSTVGML